MLAIAASALSVGSFWIKFSTSGYEVSGEKGTPVLALSSLFSASNTAEFCRLTRKLNEICPSRGAPARIGPPGNEAGEVAGSAEHVWIDDVLADRFAVERAQNVARGLLAHPVDRFPRDACDVRGHDDVGKFEQRMA